MSAAREYFILFSPSLSLSLSTLLGIYPSNPPYTGPQTGLGGVPREYTRYAQQRPKMAEPGPNGGRPMATLTHPAAQPVPLTARRQV